MTPILPGGHARHARRRPARALRADRGAHDGVSHGGARSRSAGTGEGGRRPAISTPSSTTSRRSASLAAAADVVTIEFENPPAAALEFLARRTRVAPVAGRGGDRPGPDPREAVPRRVGLPGRAVRRRSTSADADPDVTYPAILKTARLGYDGKGQRTVDDGSAMRAAWRLLGSVPCVLEQALALETEVSVVVARTAGGDVAAFPVAENTHVDGILDLTVVPAAVSRRVADRAVGLAMAIADALDYVGVLAVEMFVVDGDLVVNELAPRPHNSGHWTLDVAQTSQFAQQVRAVCGLGARRHVDDPPGGGDGQPARRPVVGAARPTGSRCSSCPTWRSTSTASRRRARDARWATSRRGRAARWRRRDAGATGAVAARLTD